MKGIVNVLTESSNSSPIMRLQPNVLSEIRVYDVSASAYLALIRLFYCVPHIEPIATEEPLILEEVATVNDHKWSLGVREIRGIDGYGTPEGACVPVESIVFEVHELPVPRDVDDRKSLKLVKEGIHFSVHADPVCKQITVRSTVWIACRHLVLGWGCACSELLNADLISGLPWIDHCLREIEYISRELG